MFKLKCCQISGNGYDNGPTRTSKCDSTDVNNYDSFFEHNFLALFARKNMHFFLNVQAKIFEHGFLQKKKKDFCSDDFKKGKLFCVQEK